MGRPDGLEFWEEDGSELDQRVSRGGGDHRRISNT